MPRQTLEEPRDQKTWVYLTMSEATYLKMFAHTLDVTVSAVIRALVQQSIYNARARNEFPRSDLVKEDS
jgi:hypothetical protein